MNFDKAFVELTAGKKIRRKKWLPLMYMCKDNDVIRTYKGESLHLFAHSSILLSQEWTVVDGDGTKLSFPEAVNELKKNKYITCDLIKCGYVFIDDNGDFAKCIPVEYDFMPSYEDICANDWELIK